MISKPPSITIAILLIVIITVIIIIIITPALSPNPEAVRGPGQLAVVSHFP